MRSISWEQFKEYLACPRWFTWSHVIPRESARPAAYQDSQFLIRGHAIQALVDRWVRIKGYESLEALQVRVQSFLEGNSREIVQREWINDSKRGRPECSQWELSRDVEKTLETALVVLTEAWWKSKIKFKVESEKEVSAVWRGARLFARLDVLWESEQEFCIYEGKATKYKDQTNDDQLRWQIELLRCVDPEKVGDVHFYFFYNYLEFREVRLGPEHDDWLSMRNFKLLELLSGNEEPTPSSSSCKFCPHQGQCPDKHEAKKRKRAFQDSDFPKGKSKINVI